MNALQRSRARVEELLAKTKELAAEGSRDCRRSWEEFERAFLAHMTIEETLLFPHLLHAHARDARAFLAEHRHLRTRMAGLRAAFELGMESHVAIGGFQLELRAHEEREEKLLFEMCAPLLTQRDQDALAAALQEHRLL